MQKDFDSWNKIKKTIDINNNDSAPFYNEREVWWCSLGLNIGFEQDGKGKDYARPILVIKGFSKQVLLCLPLTTKQKEGKYYSNVDLKDGIQRKVILSQIRLIDSKRLQEKISTLDEIQFKEIKQKIIRLLE